MAGNYAHRSGALTLLLGVALTACRPGPLFEPDRFHHELIRHHAAESGLYAERFRPEQVCITPDRPLCYCDPNERRRLVGGLTSGERLDLTRAGIEELVTLPGIGPALAERIVEYRRVHPLTSVAQLLEVQGIGLGKLRRLLPLVTVGPLADQH